MQDETDDDLVRALEGVRGILMRHPIAVQSAFAALVAEGRHFAETPEGRNWKSRLARSELLDRLGVVWDNAGMTAFVETPRDVLPSFFVDGAVRAASKEGLEALLSRLFDADD